MVFMVRWFLWFVSYEGVVVPLAPVGALLAAYYSFFISVFPLSFRAEWCHPHDGSSRLSHDLPGLGYLESQRTRYNCTRIRSACISRTRWARGRRCSADATPISRSALPRHHGEASYPSLLCFDTRRQPHVSPRQTRPAVSEPLTSGVPVF